MPFRMGQRTRRTHICEPLEKRLEQSLDREWFNSSKHGRIFDESYATRETMTATTL